MDYEAYRSVSAGAEYEFTVNRSVFRSVIAPAADKSEALAVIEEIRRRYPGATHYVYAYRLTEGNTARFSDDGEPDSTAGKPVLGVMERLGLLNAVVVVCRWFGGIKLGAGGLIRAYASSAAGAADRAEICLYERCAEVRVVCGYDRQRRVNHTAGRCGAVPCGADYGENVELRFIVKCADYGAFATGLTELPGEKIFFEKTGERYGVFAR